MIAVICRGHRSLLFTTAAPQSIPSWIRLPCGSRSGRRLRPDTEYSVATVSPTRGRLNQRNARQRWSSPLTISDWPRVARASSSRRKKSRYNRVSCSFVAPAFGGWYFVIQGFSGSPFRLRRRIGPRPRRSEWGRCDGEGGRGGTPFVEPERRSARLNGMLQPPPASCEPAEDLRSCKVVCISPCAKGSLPTDASLPPAQSSTPDAS